MANRWRLPCKSFCLVLLIIGFYNLSVNIILTNPLHSRKVYGDHARVSNLPEFEPVHQADGAGSQQGQHQDAQGNAAGHVTPSASAPLGGRHR